MKASVAIQSIFVGLLAIMAFMISLFFLKSFWIAIIHSTNWTIY